MAAPSVIVAGAGPVGVVTALALADAGFTVTLLEAAAEVDRNPRASTTHPSTLAMIERVGLIDRFIREGLVARYFQFWDRPEGRMVAEFDHQILENDTPFPFVVQTEQHKLARMGLDRLATLPNATARMNAPLAALEQDADGVTVTLANGETLRADWLVGADGGRSAVRKAMGIEFEGYTWPERFLVLTVSDDFEAMLGCCLRNYFADPNEWANLFKVAGDGNGPLWRAVFPAPQDESDEAVLSDEAAEMRLQGLRPKDGRYDLVHRNLYRVHQRVAAQFRRGRVFLAGDAGHVNNPIGGLGLNFGVHDAMDLADTLSAHVFGGADSALLDGYERRRRTLNIEFVQQQTVANKKRLEEKDPEKRRASLDQLAATAADPAKAREFLLRTSLIESTRRAAAMT
ncbi:FAD-dependent oxidoreductase [Roseomonas populi]|uniref:FAD-dependent monooxygenase n=1 Tax=Roseomonas populi TaxID=3121582 RepID=A0ABT1X6N0_9PROT|nr:NAD(P)/FAD-dependent oxidoreductase [Roseomonas pecuniae]MCR0983766.1 FAD-dependent monooxygenase [Roseomonas pecuniae]